MKQCEKLKISKSVLSIPKVSQFYQAGVGSQTFFVTISLCLINGQKILSVAVKTANTVCLIELTLKKTLTGHR